MKKAKGDKRKKKNDEIILIKDLAPRKNVQGGAGKLLFGERAATAEGEEPTAETHRKRATD